LWWRNLRTADPSTSLVTLRVMAPVGMMALYFNKDLEH
jgi:hypothetical protein